MPEPAHGSAEPPGPAAVVGWVNGWGPGVDVGDELEHAVRLLLR